MFSWVVLTSGLRGVYELGGHSVIHSHYMHVGGKVKWIRLRKLGVAIGRMATRSAVAEGGHARVNQATVALMPAVALKPPITGANSVQQLTPAAG